MRDAPVRAIGLTLTVVYAGVIGWLYVQQPQSAAELTGGFSATLGTYRIDQPSFDAGVKLFRQDRFAEARAAFERADPARQDARTQFYIAYSFYRQGWGRVYSDNGLFQQGVEAVDRAIGRAPAGELVVDDPELQMHTAGELKVELEAGLRREPSDLNPMRLLRQRK
jgi:hypothetical protein